MMMMITITKKFRNNSRYVLLFILFLNLYRVVNTYSMVQSPSSEANWFAGSQEIPSISRNPKVM